jgi:hypothetical protein
MSAGAPSRRKPRSLKPAQKAGRALRRQWICSSVSHAPVEWTLLESSPCRRRYRPYRGRAIPYAVNRLVNVEVIVSYNGNHRDLLDLAQLAGLPAGRRIETRGEHIDMREICWSKDIWGSDLVSPYLMHFKRLPRSRIPMRAQTAETCS